MKIYCISILLFSVHLIACTSNKTKQPEKTKVIKVELPYHINLPDKGVDTLKVSSFANNITYVPLETNSKSFLNRIDRIKMNDSIIAISDFTKLLLFKMDGTFIRQIGRTGGGPGEYKYISNFLIKSDTIFIFTNARRSFLKFNLDGKFIGEIDFMQNLGYFKWDTQDNLALYDKLEGKVYFYDSDFNGIDTLLVEDNVSPNRHNFVTTNRFSIYFQEAKGKLLFSNYMSDTIWNISNSKKEAEYVFNLKKKLLPEDLRFEYLNGDFK
ncbi:MAG: 6-bladed beta-propeller [Prolixibacteraceae bacterium]|jgi:hypothetical protein|nr:6-bladed beta-propeller [Prolixibacteraceae bacterium]